MGSRDLLIEEWRGTAAEAAALLRGRPDLAWLDSSRAEGDRSRWSIVASDPRWRLVAYGDDVLRSGQAGPQRLPGSALRALTEMIESEPRPTATGSPLPFVGGAIGYLGFELSRQVELLPATTIDDVGAPDLAVGWYDAAVVEDHASGRCWLAGRPGAVSRLRAQLTLGRGASFAAYLDLRDDLSNIEVLSSSPERLLLADEGYLETRPIKGTRPRGADEQADRLAAEELLASKKDRAEHLMIVDLERNDLGRVARTGTVAVPQLGALESFPQVHHLTSTVTAELRPDVNLEALLRATFPGGSITGAPKIRALEIIDELEPTVRGVYTGAIGYLSAHGRLDLNVAIRTITLADGAAHIHVGGAIVHDSDPAAEYTETLDKARGMARALGVALPDEPEVASASASDVVTR